ncbi:rhamnogalacturonidase [Actinophytocola xanthii]|uniref:Exo-poly-alpha-D-galacturonosidase n=1 Tax=Actinophytocola xanthii TaxID=1912961 RepID=A0A1Q8CPQ6_9PSEU|nr:glycosyl hydrolase family 28-related protein [Actinophytocola xanthii]OLF16331.1 exo-poly-alpha-D-galacturonosidase [Actinophytocola xanthii]
MSAAANRRTALRLGAAGAAGGGLAMSGATPASADPSTAGVVAGPVFDVRRYGAKGDGRTIDSPAINRAIAAAAKNGGTVFFPAGTYTSYSVRLRSDVTLHLDRGATLLAAQPRDGKGFDAPGEGAGNPYQDFGHSHWRASLIWGEGLENIGIGGPGRIDGAALVRNMTPESPPGTGDKAIALKLCRNVVIRDVTIVRGGHLSILPTGVDNLSIHNVTIDTVRDGINVDCCRNVRISHCTVNTHGDDAIVLKSSYALGFPRATENVTIADSMVSGYDVGTLVEGTFGREDPLAADRDGPTGRIKFGTESNGGFRNIAISNMIFERCRGLALETVDGGLLEDVTISNITMRDVSNTPFFLRLGARMRGPAGREIGKLRRVSISDVTVHNADPRYPSMIVGLPGHDVEDVRISNVRVHMRGGLSMTEAAEQPLDLINTFFAEPGAREPYAVPDRPQSYPEPSMFGILPAWAFYVRHATGVRMDNVDVHFERPDTRPAVVLEDVRDADLHRVRLSKAEGAPTFVLRDMSDFALHQSRPVGEARIPGHVVHEEL